MNDDFDELDHALFALPLEPPPAGLRESILRATVYAPLPAFAFRGVEIALIGCVFAVGAWLLLALVTDAGLAATLHAQLLAVARVFADPSTLLWLAAGGSIVTWFSFGALVPGSGRRLWRS